MKRLIKNNNHVGISIREEVEKNIIDGERNMRINSSDSYLMAKQIIADLPLSPNNELIMKIMKYIDGGKYSDIGKSSENWEKWLERTKSLLRNDRILLAKKKTEERMYTVSSNNLEFLDEFEKFLETVNYCCAIGASRTLQLHIDGDGPADISIEKNNNEKLLKDNKQRDIDKDIYKFSISH